MAFNNLYNSIINLEKESKEFSTEALQDLAAIKDDLIAEFTSAGICVESANLKDKCTLEFKSDKNSNVNIKFDADGIHIRFEKCSFERIAFSDKPNLKNIIQRYFPNAQTTENKDLYIAEGTCIISLRQLRSREFISYASWIASFAFNIMDEYNIVKKVRLRQAS